MDDPFEETPLRPRAADPRTELEALRHEVERLGALASQRRGALDGPLERSPHGIIVCDARGRLLLQNRAAERIWAGDAPMRVDGSSRARRAFHPDGRPFASQDWALARCLASGSAVEPEELQIQRFDDSFGHLLDSSAPIFGEGGALEGGVSVFADITRFKAPAGAAQRLQEDLAAKVRELEAFAQRASRLQAVTSSLARAATVREIADVITSHGRALFGANASLLFLLDDVDGDGRTLELTSLAGVPLERIEGYRRLPLDSEAPLPSAVRRGEPVWLTGHDEVLAAFPALGTMRQDAARLEGLVALPLRTTDAVIGGLAFSFHTKPVVDPVARDVFLTVCAQCGLAIERARAFEAERRARKELQAQQERLAILAQATERLTGSLDSRHALGELARLAVPRIADWCAIDELAPDGTIRRLALEHRDPAKVALAQELSRRHPPDPNALHGVSKVLRTGQTEWMPEIPDALLVASTSSEEHLALARSLGLTSYAVVPLVARGRVLGALTLVGEGERRLGPDDLSFGEELARRAALALENARLYEAAEAARLQLHGLFMEAPAGVAILRGPEHRFELANGPYLRLASRRDVIGKTVREVFPELVDQGVFAILDRVYETGETFVASELPLVIADDERGTAQRFYNLVYQAARDGGGEIGGIAVFAFEVTDQVRARQRTEALAAEVARSEARMRALVEATAAIVWTTNAAGEVVEPSPSWLAFTGQSAAESLHGGFVEAIHPHDRAATLSRWSETVAARVPYAAEYRLRRRDGSYAHTLARGVPVLRADGAILEYIGCNVDVTELRNAETAAREHADVLATINDLGRLISAELDVQKVVQAVTDAATTITGAQFGAFFYNVLDDKGARYTLYTISGVPREAFSKFPMPRATAVFAPTFAGAGVVRSDDITQDPRYGQNAPRSGMPHGHLPVRSYLAVPVVSRSGEVIGGIFLGHERTAVFDERTETLATGLAAQAAVAMDNARLFGDAQRLIRALEATNRELDQFAYVTSHDLKAPLRGIGSLAEWIEEDLGAAITADARDKLDLLRGRVRRMEALIQGILDFSRAGRVASKPETIDVGRLLGEIVELLSPQPPAAVLLGEPLPTLETERIPLQQVFMNLIGNALKHGKRPDVVVRVEAVDAGDFWRFSVRDDGPGIAPEFHDRIWGIFQTLEARDKHESTGIGLAIVKKIVEGRGGRAWIESSEGVGAAFSFTWPKREDAASDPARADRRA